MSGKVSPTKEEEEEEEEEESIPSFIPSFSVFCVVLDYRKHCCCSQKAKYNK